MLSTTTLNNLRRSRDLLDTFAESIGNLVSWLTLLMMLVTSIVVFMRYFLNIGSIALQESVTYMHGTVFLLAIAFTLKREAHVSVDILYQKLSSRTQAFINLFGTLFFLFPLGVFVLWLSFDYVRFSWRLLESSPEPGGLPGVFLLKSLIPVMCVMLLLQGIAEIIRNTLILLSAERDSS
jgi:TRAP-type mannitol/chloroaromatic compound transport system permease small subunit